MVSKSHYYIHLNIKNIKLSDIKSCKNPLDLLNNVINNDNYEHFITFSQNADVVWNAFNKIVFKNNQYVTTIKQVKEFIDKCLTNYYEQSKEYFNNDEIFTMVAKLKEVHVMQNKPQLPIVICQLHTDINRETRKNDIIYTDVMSYKTYFENYSNLIQNIDDLFNAKYDAKSNSAYEYIMLRPVSETVIVKTIPNNLTSENIIQKITQKIWNIPDNQIDDFEYIIYLGR